MKQSWFGHVKRVVLPYVLVSAIWILASDRVAVLLLPEISQITTVQTIKGLLFVALSGSLIAWLLAREAKRQAQIIEELEASQRRYRQAVLNSPNPIFSINAEGIITACNEASRALFSYRQGLVGLHYETVVASPDSRRTVAAHVKRVLGNGVTLTGVEISFRTRDGSQRDMVSRLYPIMGPDGDVEECVFANSDVTSRRRAEERLRFQATLLDNVREAVVAIDLDGLIIYWGGGAETLYGYQAEEARLRAAILAQFPKINIGFTHARDTGDVVTTGFAITIDLPIFDRNQGAIAIENATRTKLFDEYAARLFEARGQVVRLATVLNSLQRQLEIADQLIPTLENVADSYRRAFLQGNADALTYYNARADLVAKRLESLDLRRQIADTIIALEIASGRFLESPQRKEPTP